MPGIMELNHALDLPPHARAVSENQRSLWVVKNGEFIPGFAGGYIHHASGGFAVVFHVRDAREEVALRCWLRTPPANAAFGCRTLTAFLAAHSLPYFVKQEYIEEAVWVENTWHPALLMEWVSGEPLNVAVEKRLRDPAALQRLADGFEYMVFDLQKAGIAHGDLQHANVLVGANYAMKLVDYDSVWVPALDGKSCDVTGLEGYGHPDYVTGRAPRPFNRYMDTFAGLVVLCSLRAITADPTLFQQFTKQNLLFRQEDLEAPHTSTVFAALDKLQDNRLPRLVAALRKMCHDRQQAEVLLEPLLDPFPSRITEPALPVLAPLPPLVLQADTHFTFLSTAPDVPDTPKRPILRPVGFNLFGERLSSQMTLDEL